MIILSLRTTIYMFKQTICFKLEGDFSKSKCLIHAFEWFRLYWEIFYQATPWASVRPHGRDLLVHYSWMRNFRISPYSFDIMVLPIYLKLEIALLVTPWFFISFFKKNIVTFQFHNKKLGKNCSFSEYKTRKPIVPKYIV